MKAEAHENIDLNKEHFEMLIKTVDELSAINPALDNPQNGQGAKWISVYPAHWFWNPKQVGRPGSSGSLSNVVPKTRSTVYNSVYIQCWVVPVRAGIIQFR